MKGKFVNHFNSLDFFFGFKEAHFYSYHQTLLWSYIYFS